MTKKLLTSKLLAQRWYLSLSTLNRWRWKGGGSPYVKFNRRIMYNLQDVQSYEKTKLLQHTSEQTIQEDIKK
jgi:hypothetical protein